MARRKPGSGSGIFVSVLTAAALGVVGFFAFQASAASDQSIAAPPAESADPEEEEPGTDDIEDVPDEASEPVLPAESGQGKRVVYSIGEQRVWLVDVSADGLGEDIVHTYEVFPSTVSPVPGEYEVTSRSGQVTGSDGIPIEHVVRFADVDGIVVGFSSALDESVPDPEADEPTGGVRQSREDGDAMWLFAMVGDQVVVVP